MVFNYTNMFKNLITILGIITVTMKFFNVLSFTVIQFLLEHEFVVFMDRKDAQNNHQHYAQQKTNVLKFITPVAGTW